MQIKLLGLLSLSAIIVLVNGQNITEPELLVPNYDNVVHKLKAFSIRQPLVLHCNITKAGDFELIWEKHGKDVSTVDSLNGRYSILRLENTFFIERAEEEDAGHYSCRLNTTKKEFKVMSRLAVRTVANIVVMEAEPFTIVCDVLGTKPKLYWQIGNRTIYNSTDRYILSENDDGVDNAVLRVVNSTLDDRGEYKCVAGNLLTDLNVTAEAIDVTYVRIKDSMASVWPALGIGAELLILCITTCIFNRLDKNKELEEGDE